MAKNGDPRMEVLLDRRMEVLLDLLERDRQHVMVYVGVCFGVPALSLSALKLEAVGVGLRVLLVLSLAGFVLAGIFYFLYAQRLHWMRLGGIQAIMDRNPEALRTALFDPKTGPWARYAHLYLTGQVILVLAAVLYVGFFVLYAVLGVFS